MTEDDPQQRQLARISKGMFVLMWLLVLGVLTLFFNTWLDRQHNPNQSPSVLLAADGAREVVLQRNRFGHYVTTGYINGQPVVFMLDTGATDISIPAPIARELGLRQGRPVTYRTANGMATGYTTVLDSVAIGDIVLEGVRASINPNVDHDDVLLGMTFLKHLEFTQRGDTLTLRQYP